MSEQPELKPCPFCGDENPHHQWTGNHVHVECMDCHVCLPHGGATWDEKFCKTEQEALDIAAKKWNTRTTGKRPIAEVPE
jgi:hypothetical protein